VHNHQYDSKSADMRQPVVTAIVVRAGSAGDLDAVDAIQRACPEAAHWKVAEYLDHDFRVAIVGNSIGGFIVLRNVAPDEREILNLAVAPEWRRKGIASALLEAGLRDFHGSIFLEVRESNGAGRKFYKLHSFQEVSKRPYYYESPPEAAIVMKFHSC
jgi:ribosomal-protein-alanine N-acetyltransferase